MKRVLCMSPARVAGILLAFLIALPAEAVIINLDVTMDGAQANAGAGTGSPGTGSATITFDTVTQLFSWSISWSGLIGTPFGMHFHGAALPNTNAVVQVSTGVAGPPVVGNAFLTAAQAADMLAGLWYLNLHTTVNPGGEIRGQVLITTDSDGDGVDDPADFCPDTVIAEGVPTKGALNPNHWALTDDDGVFDTVIKGKGKGPNRSYTIEDTAGCSCEQIIEIQGLGDGHSKHGCSISAMDDWVDVVNMP